jgi:hypothetical protein
MSKKTVYINYNNGRRPQYGCLSFLGDVFMTCITGGLWLIWVFIREMRNRR